jgi:NAD(P)-dependent dehydrogenase (short-subunit alcohol dehydrogenase family)
VHEFEFCSDLKGKTIFITGASRGIGLAIALRAAKDGANIAIAAKTVTPQKNLPGTIYTAADEIKQAGGNALPIQCDIRDEESVKKAIELTVKTFGGIDILINNASAINLSNTNDLDMKRYDLMQSINSRGTFMCSKYCIPYLKNSKNGHILNISPPLNFEEKWFKDHVAYSIAKYGMSLCVLGMSAEFRSDNIGVNALWPRTAISTAAVVNLLGGEDVAKISRKPEIMADAAYVILTSKSDKTTGNFFVDDEVLGSIGVHDLSKYNMDPKIPNYELAPDFFV